ncbi:MAG: 30S ribosomal protein S8 [Candidatus Marinimicrobia bacterium]|jgi:small subunit ribosomal protein S8|nr:30S ribosomal protein S8 [Candidatus Neomarinimicrobiota bacterium]MBT4149172.1 30S ribosomal protein S8 [Candidatus Neomarinimicrobiota bacterium]MBT4318034.1 30S ribosomal protein S8 [Candidatus Neomarinimicrobiota bacterium]MBT5097390.1 30S ribosomal protein S8 [Candidatus Neomarinimicrobiota bacterium]MBT5440016.1 30S ribosomal protein S8 [Candidatus Neomarinimicrobiota bacterium]|tara:strand:- start:156 stop:560 length:405 start_codon:yes stop_codon:yes gene_type:complete
MSMTDPVADMLTRIRNGMSVDKRFVDIPSSNLKKRIAFVLKQENYIEDFMFVENKDNVKSLIRIFLKYDNRGKAVITGIERVSKPGRRIYVGGDQIPRVLDGLGIAILSTSKGVISNKAAKRMHIGGEVLCNIW